MGSEMCIRDRPNPRASADNYKAWVSPAANMDAWDRAYADPLPLPTTHKYILAGGLGGERDGIAARTYLEKDIMMTTGLNRRGDPMRLSTYTYASLFTQTPHTL